MTKVTIPYPGYQEDKKIVTWLVTHVGCIIRLSAMGRTVGNGWSMKKISATGGSFFEVEFDDEQLATVFILTWA